MRKILPIVVLNTTLLTGCTMAPLATQTTAHSNGKNQWKVDAGLAGVTGGITATAKASYGVTDRIDVGVEGETGFNNIVGGWGRFSVQNQDEGASFAIVGGAGAGRIKGEYSLGSTPVANHETTAYYIYAGPIFSYRADKMEPFLHFRLNHVHLNEAIVPKTESELKFNFADSANYATTSIGSNFWLNDNFALTAAGNILIASNGASSPYITLGLSYQHKDNNS